MSQQNVQAARGLYDAFNRGDLAAFEQGCSREFAWNEADHSTYAADNPYRNFRQVKEGVFEPTMRDYDGFRCDLERLIDGGEHVIGSGRYSGRNRATGKTLSAQFCHVIHFDSGAKLDRIQEYTDTLAEAEAEGRAELFPEMRIPNPVM